MARTPEPPGLDPETVYTPEEFPLYYESTEEFTDGDGLPSGARGAVAEHLIELNNYPHIAYGLRVVNHYALDQAFLNANPGFKAFVEDGGFNEEQRVAIDFAQQNITARPIHQRTLTGKGGINWHPFPTPYLLRGGNQVRVTIRRLQNYPQFLVGEELRDILPTAEVTLVTGVLVSDRFPAAGPPSTDADDMRRRG